MEGVIYAKDCNVINDKFELYYLLNKFQPIKIMDNVAYKDYNWYEGYVVTFYGVLWSLAQDNGKIKKNKVMNHGKVYEKPQITKKKDTNK